MTRLTEEELERKTAVACFARDGVSQQTREAFEDTFALGRMFHESYSACVTASHKDKSINELVALCCSGFSATSNPFYPYFLVILDEQTEQDGSACLVHRIGDETTRTLRVHPHTLSGFMGVASIEHTTIEDIILNNCPEDDPEQANAFVYGDAVPPTRNRFGTTHHNVRVQVTSFIRSEEPSPGFTTLRMSNEQVGALGLPAVAIKLVWFGEPPETILLQAVSTKKVPVKHVVGEVLA